MQHKVFGKLKFDSDDDSWAGKRRFPEFLPFRETPHRGKAPITSELFVGVKDEEPPSPAQVLAFQFFVEHEKNVCGTIIDAVFRWYVRRRKQEQRWFEEQECPEILKPDELRDLMEFGSLRVRCDEFKGTALLGFSFGCKWDDEHGLGVLLHRSTILDVGQADVAFHEPNARGSVWLKVCAAREKKAAQAVLKPLQGKRRRQKPSPFETQYIKQIFGSRKRMQEFVRLQSAVYKGDCKRIREMVVKGININDIPDGSPHPMFAAIRDSNIDMVKTLLELGADLQVEFYGTTILEKAVETITLLGYKPGGPLGDRFKEQHDRATEVLRLVQEAATK
jgi:hypothetical protein